MKITSNIQRRLKSILTACFLLMSFALAHAQQPYNFTTEEHSGLYMCSTKGEGYGVNENTFAGEFSIGCFKNHNVNLVWGLFPKDKDTGIDLFLLDEEGITIKFQLSNGEIFETVNPERTGQLYWFGAKSTSFKSNKTVKHNAFDAGSYFIGQLRKFNITKISILDKSNHRVEFATNGFRSAVTIDAMCKTLMAKTGNQGQYGSVSNNNSSGNSSSDFLRQNAKKPGIVTLPSGLQYKVLRKGNGAIATTNDLVEIKYDCRLVDGKIINSTNNKTETCNPNIFIKGFKEAITKMPEGSKWVIYVPYQLGYGEKGAGKIPPFSTLIFNVELVKVIKNGTR